VKGINIVILATFIVFVIAIVGLTLNFFHVFEEGVFILNLSETSKVNISQTLNFIEINRLLTL